MKFEFTLQWQGHLIRVLLSDRDASLSEELFTLVDLEVVFDLPQCRNVLGCYFPAPRTTDDGLTCAPSWKLLRNNTITSISIRPTSPTHSYCTYRLSESHALPGVISANGQLEHKRAENFAGLCSYARSGAPKCRTPPRSGVEGFRLSRSTSNLTAGETCSSRRRDDGWITETRGSLQRRLHCSLRLSSGSGNENYTQTEVVIKNKGWASELTFW